MKGKHLRPIPGYTTRTVRDKDGRGHEITVKATIGQKKRFDVRCTRPGTVPVTETYRGIVALNSADASIQAQRLMRSNLRCSPSVAIYTKVTEVKPEVGATVQSPVPAKFRGKKVDPKRGVTNDPKPAEHPAHLVKQAQTMRKALAKAKA